MEPEPWGAGRSKRRGGQGELLGALLEEECSGGGACWSPVCLRWKRSGPHSRWVVVPICLIPGKSSKVGGANTIYFLLSSQGAQPTWCRILSRVGQEGLRNPPGDA